jgi:diaminopimelate decarboxylase
VAEAVPALVAEHGSPLWLVDLDRVRERLAAFRGAWTAAWPQVEIAYSYKTNRLPAILRTLADAGAAPEVVSGAEYALARDVVGAPGADIVVNGPAKPSALLSRAAADGALVVADSAEELDRFRAAGIRRAGLRVALPGVGAGATRFGIPQRDVLAAAARARDLGLELELLSVHLVSTGFTRPLEEGMRLGEVVTVEWPRPPDEHAAAADVLAALARELGVEALDLGGGHPAAPGVHAHAHDVAAAIRAHGFTGRLIVEPGRAVVADAVDLALSVAAVKRLEDGATCVVTDAGTNLLPGALWSWPRLEPVGHGHDGAEAEPTLVTGPLCLNVDVLHPAAALPPLRAGDLLLARAVGAYQQAQSTQFGELRPAVVGRENGGWRALMRRESVEDLIAGDLESPAHRTGEEP